MSAAAAAQQPQGAAATAAATPAANWDEHVKQTLAKLHQVYMTYVKPLEDRYKYDLFRPSWFEETILNQRPFVTFFGPWSAGKSTFINHLLQSNYLWTGPQPTTAEFTVILHGEETGPLDGRVLVNAKDLPFKGLNEFGESFLQNFQGFQCDHELLKSVTLVDTPGVLESAKEIHQRKYDYIKLSRWFAERSDLIFVLFDPSKLDAGVELKMMFKHAFKGQEGKVRIILNKADSINTQELMRVYGSLFWNLSNMISSTEPPRVYVGSFWDQPYKPGTFHLLFSEEKADLIHELTEVVPAQALDKKIASLIRRAKEVFVHSIIIGQMRSSLPMLFGKEKAKRKALDELHITYEKVGAKYKMNWRDFPPVEEYRTFLEKFDLETFPELEKVDKEGLLTQIRNCIDTILPRMLRPVKSTALADPRNKEQRAEMQQRYHQTIKDQFEGKQGIQGSSDTVRTDLRASPLAGIAVPPMQQQQQQQAGIPAQGAATAAPAGTGGDQQAMMMQMMMAQMMAQMQQQQQQQQLYLPQAPVAQPAPAPQPALDQQAMMMQMMMAQMQQKQQQQPPPAAVPVSPQPASQPAVDQQAMMMQMMMAQMQQQQQAAMQPQSSQPAFVQQSSSQYGEASAPKEEEID